MKRRTKNFIFLGILCIATLLVIGVPTSVNFNTSLQTSTSSKKSLMPDLSDPNFSYSLNTNRLSWKPGATAHNPAAGWAKEFDVSYDWNSKVLRWIVHFEEHNGVLPNGFKFAVNGTGQNPKGHDGELAFFYFDVSDPDDPVLTVYGYRGYSYSWHDGSFAAGTQTPDTILSSKVDDSFVIDFVVEETGPTSRKLGFVIDSTKIQEHIPAYPGDLTKGEIWRGATFYGILGMWFHPVAELKTTYKTGSANDSPLCRDDFEVGYLCQWGYSKIGWYDTAWQRTHRENPRCKDLKFNIEPVTEEVCYKWQLIPVGDDSTKIQEYEFCYPQQVYKFAVGQEVHGTVYIEDLQDDELLINYIDLPLGTNVDINDGDLTIPGGDTIGFTWTPSVEDANKKFKIQVVGTDPYGASSICIFNFETKPNEAPICQTNSQTIGNDAFLNLPCDQDSTTISLDAANSYDPDQTSEDGLIYEWSTDCPDGRFDNSSAKKPNLSFNNLNSNGTPTFCHAYLTVKDHISTAAQSTSCIAPISISTCQLDCEGIINGTKEYDQCGVCDGDSKSCIDCAGEPFGNRTVDRCGVCGGDESSCCQKTNQKAVLATLDQNAKKQEALVKNAARKVKKLAQGDKAIVKFVKKSLEEAHALQLRNWALSWKFPLEYQDCTFQTEYCDSEEYLKMAQEYASRAKKLRKIALSLMKRYKKLLGGNFSKKDKKFVGRIKRFYKKTVLKDLEKVYLDKKPCANTSW